MTGKVQSVVALGFLAVVGVIASLHTAHVFWGNTSKLTYETVEVTRGPISKTVSTSGSVRARVTVSVSSQLSGQISELRADFNSEVKAGDVLAVIDDKSFRAPVAQGMADLAAARAMLAHQIAALAKVEAIERNAERIVTRQQTLNIKGISAAATLDNALRDLEVARSEFAAAKAQVENAKATIAQREAQLLQVQIDLERTRIRSPIDGTVVARAIDVGQIVAASCKHRSCSRLRRICAASASRRRWGKPMWAMSQPAMQSSSGSMHIPTSGFAARLLRSALERLNSTMS